jgi:hypothetical protein
MVELRNCEVGALFTEDSVKIYENGLQKICNKVSRRFCTMQHNMKALENIFFTFGLIAINS